ncbi:MAG: hypothetical protein KJ950_07060 [Proteobacteria bacterium]|nr:hypothetical protein [Pseudomonadota bacterium]MBU1687003.1 hypothetical protein [Pseudomonadota bacterium]
MKLPIVTAWLPIIVTLLVLGGCGKKTRLVPPQAVIPARITDLRYQLDTSGVKLYWSWPERSNQGERLHTINEFILERAVFPKGTYCSDCPVTYEILATIDGGNIPETRQARTVEYQEANLTTGTHYLYRVRSSMGWPVISNASEPVEFTWQPPVVPPAHPTAKAYDQKIILSWQPPVNDINGTPLTAQPSYRIERSEDQEKFSLLAHGIMETIYTDRRVTNGTPYTYRIRAERKAGGIGLYSTAITATPLDLTPPPPPRHLSTIMIKEGIRILWEPVLDPDIAGYLLYRRVVLVPETSATMPEDSGYEVIAKLHDPGANNALDREIPARVQKIIYALKSYDRATPANTSPLSQSTTIIPDR